MAVRTILGTDKLESGFRVKYNETVLEIIVSGELNSEGKLVLKKFQNSGTITIPLLGLFYSRAQIDQMFLSGVSVPDATEIAKGILELATIEEVNVGEDDQRAITPFKLKNTTLLPFKGVWSAPGVDDDGYRNGQIVVRNNFFYISTLDGNKSDPASDLVKWNVIGDGSSASTRIAIPVTTGNLVIEWQTDVIPGDTLTYSQRYGNIIGDIVNQWEDSGTIRKNSPEWFYTMDGTDIDTVTINTLFEGTITIL